MSSLREDFDDFTLQLVPILSYASSNLSQQEINKLNEITKIIDFLEDDENNQNAKDFLEYINLIMKNDKVILESNFKKDFVKRIDRFFADLKGQESLASFDRNRDEERQDNELDGQDEPDKIGQNEKTLIETKLNTLEDYYKDIEENLSNLDQKLNDVHEKETKLNAMNKYLNGDIQEKNFAILSEGFKGLLDEKIKEKDSFLFWVRLSGIMIILIPILSLFKDYELSLDLFIFKIVPTLTVEVFLIYYFKIFLHNYTSVKDQILQINTKRALLSFISDYNEYKQDNKVEQDSIEKFEDIIFSKITQDNKQSPGSPDLVSLIDKISKSIKTK